MALKDDIQAAKEELIALDGAITSIGQNIKDGIGDQMDSLNETTQKVAKSFQRDLGSAINRSNKSLDEQEKIRNKILKGQDASKDIEKEIQKVQKERDTILRKIEGLKRIGLEFNEEEVYYLEESLRTQEEQLGVLNDINTAQIANRGISGNILESAKEYLISLDKSGLAAKVLSGELNNAQKFSLLAESAFLTIAKAALAGSDNIANLEKNLGISYESAYDLQKSLAITAVNSDKLFITSKDLNKSFTDLVNTTGLLSDFGGDTLITMTTLTKQLGLGVGEASQLALLARTQGEDTESILENTVDTVNAVNRQRKSAVSAKAVLNDIATASKSIVVSLGMSPELLAEAATEARALGLNLEKVDAIANSLLNFESSIASELEAELLLGKELNLEKARSAALDNDLATLSKEIADNTALTETFATGNRIQQEAAAAALGMNRDDLANMVMQQELLNMSQDEFIDKYGEQSYQQMQAMSASEKFEESLNKIKGVIGDIGTIFSPIIDGFASIVGYLAESKGVAGALLGILTGLAAIQTTMAIKSIATAYAKIFEGSFMAGPFGLPLALAGAAALGGLIAGATQMVQDGIAPSSKGPFTITDAYGATAITAKGDGLAVSPNISRGGGSSQEQQRTNMLLEKLLAKDTNINMDGRKLNNSMQTSGVSYDIGV